MQGQKTQLKRLDTAVSPNAYVQMSGVLSVEDATEVRAPQDTTTLDQTSKYKTSEPGMLIDAGELETILEFDADGAAEVALKADFKADVNQSYQLLFPDGTTFDFSGSITEFGRATPQEDRVTRSVKFKISGEPLITAG